MQSTGKNRDGEDVNQGIVIDTLNRLDQLEVSLLQIRSSLMRRMGTAVSAAGFARSSFMHLQAAHGALLVVPAGPDTLLIAIGDRHINLGLARIEMLQAAEQLG